MGALSHFAALLHLLRNLVKIVDLAARYAQSSRVVADHYLAAAGHIDWRRAAVDHDCCCAAGGCMRSHEAGRGIYHMRRIERRPYASGLPCPSVAGEKRPLPRVVRRPSPWV